MNRPAYENNRKIMVIGHKNPDTDSICSAIAYADYKCQLSDSNSYVPRRAGEISSETRFVLNYFNVRAPHFVDDVSPQVKDMDIRLTPGVDRRDTLRDAWEFMRNNSAVTLAITDDDGRILGIITKGDVAETFMDARNSYFLSSTKPSFGDIAETVSGRIVTGNPDWIYDTGRVIVGAALVKHMMQNVEQGDLVILADQTQNQVAALEAGARALVLCVGAKADDKVVSLAEKKDAVIIETDADTYSAARVIDQSVPLEAVMKTDDLITFELGDRVEDVTDKMAHTRHHAFPVVDDEGRYVGTISRRNLLDLKKKQVILVDHNEREQAVDNVEEADILEIIDHHKIGSLETIQPIFFINRPVGCTATTIYEMYVDHNLEIDPPIAGLLCSAILSDTLMFRSPTCTGEDKDAAEALAEIAGIDDIEEYAMKMFKAGSDLKSKSAEEIFYQDYKKFTAGDISFGVGQISSMDREELAEIRSRVLPLMNKECGKNGISDIFFLLTDIRDSSSEIIFAGEESEDMITRAFRKRAVKTEHGYEVKGLLSRKKQLIPEFMRVLSDM